MDRRLGKRKRVFFPNVTTGLNDPSRYVDLPVITALPIIGTNAQELKHKLVNDRTNESRTVVTKRVQSSKFNGNDVTYNSGKYIDVERIQTFRIVGSVDIEGFELKNPAVNAQQYNVRLNNKDPAPQTPESVAGISDDDIGHFKVHYVRFYKDNHDSGGDWLTVEYIDEMHVIGTNGQLFKYKFKNLTAEEYANFGNAPSGRAYGSPIFDSDPYKPILGYCDPSLELVQDESAPWRLDPLQNIVNIGGGEVVLSWAYKPESYTNPNGIGPAIGLGYNWRNEFGNFTTVTLADGRHGVVGGAQPVVPAQTVFAPPPGEFPWQAFPWWLVGPNTDNSISAETQHLIHYNWDADNPGGADPSFTSVGAFSHPWPFFGYHWPDDGSFPGVYDPIASFSVTFGPVTFTVDGSPWTLKNLHVAFTAVPEAEIGAAPNLMDFNPFFSATFEE